MKYKDVPHQWVSANTQLGKKSDDGKTIDTRLGVAVSLSRAQMADTHSMQDCYAWLFGDYTWKHTYTPVVAAVIAADKFAAEHKAEADKIVTMPSNTMPATTTEHNLDIVRDILTIAGLEGISDIVTVPGLN